MCSHFHLKKKGKSSIKSRFKLAKDPKFNGKDSDFFPSRKALNSLAPIVINHNDEIKLLPARWDLIPKWWSQPLEEKNYTSYNARIETLSEKDTYKDAWKNGQRCLIPATGFYEWQNKKQMSDTRSPLKFEIQKSDYPLFAFAGIWSLFNSIDNENLYTFTIITTEADEQMLTIPHHRMPVIINTESELTWLDHKLTPEDAIEVLRESQPTLKLTQLEKPKEAREELFLDFD